MTSFNNDFISERVAKVESDLVHRLDYVNNQKSLLTYESEFANELTYEQKKLFITIQDLMNELATITDKECYRMGFIDAINLMAGNDLN